MKSGSDSQAMSVVSEHNGNFVNYVLTTIEAVILVDDARQQQMKAIRKLILDRHNENLREIRKQLTG